MHQCTIYLTQQSFSLKLCSATIDLKMVQCANFVKRIDIDLLNCLKLSVSF